MPNTVDKAKVVKKNPVLNNQDHVPDEHPAAAAAKGDEVKEESYLHWSEDSGDEAYGKVKSIERQYFKTYGGHQNDKFYIPKPGHRQDNEQGDHVVALNLVRHFVLSFKGENIKTLPQYIETITKLVLPEADDKIKPHVEALKALVVSNRESRKEATSRIKIPQNRSAEDKSFIQRIRSQFIEGDKYQIQTAVEAIASSFLEIFDETNSFPKKLRTAISKEGSTDEGTAVDRLISIDELLGLNAAVDAAFTDSDKGASGNSRFSDLKHFVFSPAEAKKLDARLPSHHQKVVTKLKDPASRAHIINHIAFCISSLLDYSKTGKPNVVDDSGDVTMRLDDEAVLYKSAARHMVITFATFKNINSKLSLAEKEEIYDKFLDNILEAKGWGKKIGADGEIHQVIDSNGIKKPLNKALLKEGIAKFAKMDFQNGLKMKDPKDPNNAERPPENFVYCDDDLGKDDELEEGEVSPVESAPVSTKIVGKSKSVPATPNKAPDKLGTSTSLPSSSVKPYNAKSVNIKHDEKPEQKPSSTVKPKSAATASKRGGKGGGGRGGSATAKDDDS